MAEPIWKDKFVDLGNYAYCDYILNYEVGGVTQPLFQGRAYKKPGESTIKVRVNDLCASKVSAGTITGVSGTTITVSGRFTDSIFMYKKPAGQSSWTILTPLQFNPDWSYRSAAGQTIHTSPTLKNTCHRYQIVYVNSFGSWETFIIQGNVKRSDNVKRYTLQPDYDNQYSFARGKRNYVSEITPQYTICTHAMTDSEAAEVPEILKSTQAYLWDSVQQSCTPLVISNSSAEYKTVKGNGGKLSQYTITAELAQDRIIR